MGNKIKRVLISVTDKKGIVDFAKGLKAFGVEILSTGGTAAQIKAAGIDVTDVSAYTGFPEMMDGRLKTLHPKVHGGLLALRDHEEHMSAARAHGIEMIDMVVINLYRFEDTVAKEGCTLEEAIENIDIGGPTMVRSAAKNYRFVSIVTDPDDYPKIIEEMKKTGGEVSENTNFMLSTKAFQLTARYDAAISNWLGTILPGDGKKDFPDVYTLQFLKAQDLRYGENPHQKAVFYREGAQLLPGIAGGRQLQGKELSYNNIMDSDAAWQMACDFELPTAVIMKHANPCGAATSKGRHPGGIQEGPRDRPPVGLRRHRGREPARRQEGRRGDRQALPGGRDRTEIRARGPQGIRVEEKPPPHRDRGVLHRRQEGL